jgi:hypothetical protein
VERDRIQTKTSHTQSCSASMSFGTKVLLHKCKLKTVLKPRNYTIILKRKLFNECLFLTSSKHAVHKVISHTGVNLTHKCLEPRPLPCTSLLLDWHDLQDLILKRRSNKEVNDLKFLSSQKSINCILMAGHRVCLITTGA